MPTPDLTKLAEKTAEALKGKTLQCPHCEKEFALQMQPQLQEKTVLTMAYELQEGHMMQAVSIGEAIAAMGRLLRATAKHIGGNVEVFVNDARFEERRIAFDFLILSAPSVPKKKRNHAAK
jgi:hypothetical protein